MTQNFTWKEIRRQERLLKLSTLEIPIFDLIYTKKLTDKEILEEIKKACWRKIREINEVLKEMKKNGKGVSM